jgi:branched-chain amino acid transport system permease protein
VVNPADTGTTTIDRAASRQPRSGASAGIARLGGRPAVAGGLFVVVALVIFFFGSQYAIYEATLIAIYGLVTVAQDMVLGRAGVISLGAAAIMAVGAFTTARLSTVAGWGEFPIPLLISFIFGAVVGLVIGIPGLRFKGLYLMLTTLALQFVINFAAQSYQGVNQEAGFTVIPPHWGSLLLDNPKPLFVICVVVLGLTLLALAGVYRGVPGRAWSALRQSESGAAALGVHLVRWKLAAFIGSAALTAVGGSLYAYQVGQVSYTSYTLDLSLVLVVMVFIGGIRTMVGPIIGAAALVLLPELIQQVGSHLGGLPGASSWLTVNGAELADAIYGLVLVIVLIYERGGLWALIRRLGRLIARPLARSTQPAAAGSGGD